MRRIHRETTATTIADATLESTQSVTNVCQEHVAVMAKRSQTGRHVSPDPVPHTDDATAPHVPPASAASRCPATPRVRSTGSVTVADRLPHLDHRLDLPPLLRSPRCRHRRVHPRLHHRHAIIHATHGDALTGTYEGTTGTITTTGATATAIGSHTHLRHSCPAPLPLTTVSSAKSGEVSTLILISYCLQ